MSLTLTARAPIKPGVIASGILPERLSGKSLAEVTAIEVLDGRKKLSSKRFLKLPVTRLIKLLNSVAMSRDSIESARQ